MNVREIGFQNVERFEVGVTGRMKRRNKVKGFYSDTLKLVSETFSQTLETLFTTLVYNLATCDSETLSLQEISIPKIIISSHY